MPASKFLKQVGGAITEESPTVTSAADKHVATDSNGKLDISLMPAGVAPDTASITTSEALAAGDLVNIYNSSGAKARKADASTSGKEAMGFVIAAVLNAGTATVYFEGNNGQVTGLTPGPLYLSATVPGGVTSTAPSGSGQIVQRVGFATSATNMNFDESLPIILA